MSEYASIQITQSSSVISFYLTDSIDRNLWRGQNKSEHSVKLLSIFRKNNSSLPYILITRTHAHLTQVSDECLPAFLCYLSSFIAYPEPHQESIVYEIPRGFFFAVTSFNFRVFVLLQLPLLDLNPFISLFFFSPSRVLLTSFVIFAFLRILRILSLQHVIHIQRV